MKSIFVNFVLMNLFQLGHKKYAVFAIKGPTLNFEIPPNFEQDGVTERVNIKYPFNDTY